MIKTLKDTEGHIGDLLKKCRNRPRFPKITSITAHEIITSKTLLVSSRNLGT